MVCTWHESNPAQLAPCWHALQTLLPLHTAAPPSGRLQPVPAARFVRLVVLTFGWQEAHPVDESSPGM